jgi:DNA-binding IclR family transcriptional regulator
MEPGEAAVLEALGRRPATVGQLMLRSGLDAAAVERGLERLAGTGLVTGESGWWSRT